MSRGTAALVIASCVSCGRLGFGPASSEDATSASSSLDAAPTDACALTAFSEPRLVMELSSPSTDFGGQISADGLTYYFDSDRAGTQDIYVATRTTRDTPFGMPMPVTELDSTDFDSDASVTDDGLELYMASGRAMPSCIYSSHRATTGSLWSTPQQVPALCTSGDSGPFVTGDGLTLVYNTLADGVGEGTLMISQRASRNAAFTAGNAIAELSLGPNKGYPALSRDGLTLYYEGSGAGITHVQLWQASRPSLAEPFGTPALIPNVDDDDRSNVGDASITADGLELWFASDRGGSNDIYVATRSCEASP